jgi:hypothetical protein
MSLVAVEYQPEEIARLRASIRERMFREAPYVRRGDFTKAADQDVLLLFRLYDELFFRGELHPLVMQKSGVPLKLKISSAMTSAGGKTTRYRQRMPDGSLRTWYQIAIAGRLLLNSFRPGDRTIHVSGQECTDRLDAMMRIMEHELIHLLEMLTFGNSSCSRTRFMTLARRIFGHVHPKHGLITMREYAATKHQLRAGEQVEFRFDGRTLRGLLNRVGVRATVLVPDPRGRRYSDGQHYTKFYVPLARLTKISR